MNDSCAAGHSALVESVHSEVVVGVGVEASQLQGAFLAFAAEVHLVFFCTPAKYVSGGAGNRFPAYLYVAAVAHACYNYSVRLCRGLSGGESEHSEVEQGEFAVKLRTVLYADVTGLYGLLAYKKLVREVLQVPGLVEENSPFLAVSRVLYQILVRSLCPVGILETEVLVGEVNLYCVHLVFLAKVNLQPFSSFT